MPRLASSFCCRQGEWKWEATLLQFFALQKADLSGQRRLVAHQVSLSAENRRRKLSIWQADLKTFQQILNMQKHALIGRDANVTAC